MMCTSLCVWVFPSRTEDDEPPKEHVLAPSDAGLLGPTSSLSWMRCAAAEGGKEAFGFECVQDCPAAVSWLVEFCGLDLETLASP